VELLDTDVLIDVQRGVAPAVAWFQSMTDLPAVPGFVAMELIQDALNSRQIRDVQKLIAPFTIIWPSEGDCRRALADFSKFHLSHGLGLLDALIAACAVGADATLLSFNIKHYRVIPGLSVKEPYLR
jgi:predicted nucleic acid-binding protein